MSEFYGSDEDSVEVKQDASNAWDNLTKSELLVMLKKAYLRGMWEHADQRTKSRVDMNGPFRMLDIPDSIVEDLIEK